MTYVGEIHIAGEIGADVTFAQVKAAIKTNSDAERINVFIDSPGGNAFEGINIWAALADASIPVTTIVTGEAFSAASLIAIAGDYVIMRPGARMMIHDAHVLPDGNTVLEASDLLQMARKLEEISSYLAEAYALRSKKALAFSPEYWRGKMKATTYYSAQEAVRAGLADEVA